MADTALALQKAIELALAGLTSPSDRTGSGAIAVGIHDHPPEDAAFPFVALERHDFTTAETINEPMDSHEIELAIWSKYRGSRQVQSIAAQIIARLHNTKPALEVGQCVSCRVSRCVTEREQDGQTYKGTVTIAALTSPEDL